MPGIHTGGFHDIYHEPGSVANEHSASGADFSGTGSRNQGGASPLPVAQSGTGVRRPASGPGAGRGANAVSVPTRDSHAGGAGLPQRYIAKPGGELQSDAMHLGIWVDGGGKRYLQSGGNWYQVARDDANQTWRVLHPDEPNKPGIPVQLNGDGTVGVHGNVGIKGGGGSEADKARIQAAMQTKQRELDDNKVKVSAKRTELDGVRSAQRDRQNRIDALDREKFNVMTRHHDASARARDYKQKSEQAARAYEDAKRRYDREQSSRTQNSSSERFPGTSTVSIRSVFASESTVREFQQELRQYEDKYWEWSGRSDEAARDLSKVQGEFEAAWRDKVRVDDRVSTLELELTSLESDRLGHERQLAELERERSRLESA